MAPLGRACWCRPVSVFFINAMGIQSAYNRRGFSSVRRLFLAVAAIVSAPRTIESPLSENMSRWVRLVRGHEATALHGVQLVGRARRFVCNKKGHD